MEHILRKCQAALGEACYHMIRLWRPSPKPWLTSYTCKARGTLPLPGLPFHLCIGLGATRELGEAAQVPIQVELTTLLRPEVVLTLASTNQLLLIELRVPCKDHKKEPNE